MDDKMFRDLGFKCGLEIHQQLLTERKLFCNCPTGYRNDTPDAQIVRHMRPTLSELGEYDGTALMEFKTKKRVVYQLYRDNMCTYEMDDTPPFVINKDALEIGIKLGLMLNCAIVDELHVSRKQYLDGSIPTGFQRTAVVGVGGWIPFKGRKIGISHICLEEDACREVLDEGHDVVFRTDRLSTPLLEVITDPELYSPQEAREVNELIGRMLKASGLVRRGIGSVRQDVNVSINGSTRVEMKGISKTGYVDKMTAIEALRQKYLLEIRDELNKRGFSKGSFVPVKKFVTEALRNVSTSSIISAALDAGKEFGAVRLAGFKGLLKREIQPGRTFADEFSGRVRVIACIDKLPNIAVAEIPMAEFNDDVWKKINKEFELTDKDAVMLVWGPKQDVVTAMNEIVIRATEALEGVPKETRQHLKDYTTTFERVLPGADRMYPDTDSPPVAIKASTINEYKKELPKLAYELEEKWQRSGVPERIAQLAVVTPFGGLFDKLIEHNTVKPSKLYAILLKAQKANAGLIKFDITQLEQIIESLKNGLLAQDEIVKLIADSTPDNLKANYDKLLKDKKAISDDKIAKAIDEIIKNLNGAEFKSDSDKENFIIGQVVKKYERLISGGAVKKLLDKKI